MRAVTATGTALTQSASTLPAIIIRARIADRRYIDMHRQPRAWIVRQHGQVAAPLIFVRDAISADPVLQRVDRAATAYLAFIVLVAIAARSEAVAHDSADASAGCRCGDAAIATPDLRAEQTAGYPADDGSGERIAAMT